MFKLDRKNFVNSMTSQTQTKSNLKLQICTDQLSGIVDS
jgi:hypothetical protein